MDTEKTLIISDDEPRRPVYAPPRQVGRYELGELLGSGGMADVFRAFDPTLNRSVALKFLRSLDVDQTERFMREARAQAHVEHPNICKVYEVGDAQGRPYIAMQCIEGMTLAQAMPYMPRDTKVAVLADVADALHAAHRSGLVHRDLKPSNIMLEETQEGRLHPYVMDFGLARDQQAAKLTTIGVVMGTPSYMAPEQARGERQRIDRRTDVYGLGATLYELLTGVAPFEGESSVGVLMNVVQNDATPPRAIDPSIPADLETIALKCLEKDPQRRYDSARALAEDLRRYLDGEPIAARRAGFVQKWMARARRHPTMSALLALAVVAVLGSTTAAIVTAYRSAAVAGAAQRFGQDVERIEAMARYSRMLPLHDVGRERTMIRNRIASLAGARGAAAGPAEYAIGRGYLALEQYDDSRKHLESAWNRGYRAPQVAYALGRAIGAQYQNELKETERIANKDARELRRRKLESEYRDPALTYLRQSAGFAGESAAYAEALIAYYEKRYDDALKRARTAFADVPWLYEAKTLEGDVLLAKGLAGYNSGRYDEAQQQYDAAGSAFAAASAMAPSDERALLGESERWSRMMRLAMDRGADVREAMQRGVAAAERAAVTDPSNEESFRARAILLLRFGEWQVLHGEQPSESFDRAIAMANAAIALKRDNSKAYSYLGLAYFDKARWAVTHGQDPFGLYEASVRSHRHAVELAPRDPIMLSNLANALRRHAEALHNRGVDANAMLDESIVFYDRSIAADSQWANSHNDRSLAFLTRGEWELAAGRDPMKWLAEAAASGERSARLNPKLPASFINLSIAYYDRGDWLVRQRRDPRAETEAAVAASMHALALNPKLASGHVNAASAYILNAEYAAATGNDPHEWVQRIVEEGKAALAIDPNHGSAFAQLAQAYALDVRFAKEHGRDATAAIRDARTAVAGALQIDPNDVEVLLISARVEAAAGNVPAARAAALKARQLNPAAELGSDLETQLKLR